MERQELTKSKFYIQIERAQDLETVRFENNLHPWNASSQQFKFLQVTNLSEPFSSPWRFLYRVFLSNGRKVVFSHTGKIPVETSFWGWTTVSTLRQGGLHVVRQSWWWWWWWSLEVMITFTWWWSLRNVLTWQVTVITCEQWDPVL